MRSPILVISDDIEVFATVWDAERYLEPIDVKGGQLTGYDRDGKPLLATVEKNSRWFAMARELVKLVDSNEPPQKELLKDALLRFLRSRVPRSLEQLSTDEIFELALEYRIVTRFRSWDGNWHQKLRSRFSDRELLSRDEVIRLYWAELPQSDVSRLFDFIELEYELPAGLFRPGDDLRMLWDPVRTRNPLLWPVYQVASGDKHAELLRELAKRGAVGVKSLTTFDDLMRSWCGVRQF